MNVFMLGNVNDAQIAAETAVGDYGNYDPAYQNPAATGTGSTSNANNINSGGWFWVGTTGTNGVGGIPTGGMNAADWARNRQILTGYTCSRAGCHTNTTMSVGYWGFSTLRDTGAGAVQTTGHKAAPGSRSQHVNAFCGPCHPGNPAGGYFRADAGTWGDPIAGSGPVIDGTPAGLRNMENARQYGCDQCHDMVGVLTNSTAFPHSNRNIAVYEWEAGATAGSSNRVIVGNQASGNLWMYAGFIGTTGANAAAWNTGFVSPEFFVINGAVGSGNALGQWYDGACFKCHVPVDAASDALNGGVALRAPQHNRANFANAFPGYNANGSGLATWLPYLFK